MKQTDEIWQRLASARAYRDELVRDREAVDQAIKGLTVLIASLEKLNKSRVPPAVRQLYTEYPEMLIYRPRTDDALIGYMAAQTEVRRLSEIVEELNLMYPASKFKSTTILAALRRGPYAQMPDKKWRMKEKSKARFMKEIEEVE